MHDPDFLRAIIENPYDDGLRLVYADWLEEHGYVERADFIRYQIAVFEIPNDHPKRKEIDNRFEHFLASTKYDVEYAWTEDRLELPENISCHFARRGFEDTISLDRVADIRPLEDLIFESIPYVRLWLTDWDRGQNLQGTRLLGKTKELVYMRMVQSDREDYQHRRLNEEIEPISNILTWTELHNLEQLDINIGVGSNNELENVLSTPFVNLKRFSYGAFHQSQMEDSEIQAFESDWLRSITHLDISNRVLSDLAIEQIVNSIRGGNLTNLTLDRCGLTDDKFQRFLQSNSFQNLKYLNIESNQLNKDTLLRVIDILPNDTFFMANRNPGAEEAFSSLVRSPHLTRLDYLPDGISPIISPHDVVTLQSSSHAEKVTRLYIHSSHSESFDWASIFATDTFPSLDRLTITNAVIPKLPCFRFQKLQSLTFKNCIFQDMLEFLTLSNLPTLYRVSFENVRIESNHLEQLGNRVSFPALSSISFEDSILDETQLIQFLESDTSNGFDSLSLRGCNIPDRIFDAILISPIVNSCKHFYILNEDHDFNSEIFSPQKYLWFNFSMWKQNVRVDSWTFDGFGNEWWRNAYQTVPNPSNLSDLDSRERLFSWLNSAQCGSSVRANVYPLSFYGSSGEARKHAPFTPNPDFNIGYAQKILRRFLKRNHPDQGSANLQITHPEEAFQNLDRQTFSNYIAEILPDGTLEDGPVISWHRPRFSDEAHLDEFFTPQLGLERENAPASQYRNLLMNRMFPNENTIFFGAGLGEGEERVLLIFDEYFIGVVIGSKYTP